MPVVLVVGWLVADALQPSHYSAVRTTISVAAGHAGRDHWVGTSALLAIGVGFLLCAAVLPVSPLRGRLGLFVTGACGVGVALCPESATGPTTSHEIFSVTGALLLAAGPLFTMQVRGDGSVPRLPIPLAQRPAFAVGATVVFAVLTAYLVVELNIGDAAGLAERLAVSLETAWPLAVALSVRSRN